MALIDDLRAAAPAVDAQYQPSSNESAGLLASLILYSEHGQAFLAAAADGTDAVTGLLEGEAAPAPSKSSSSSSPPSSSSSGKDKS